MFVVVISVMVGGMWLFGRWLAKIDMEMEETWRDEDAGEAEDDAPAAEPAMGVKVWPRNSVSFGPGLGDLAAFHDVRPQPAKTKPDVTWVTLPNRCAHGAPIRYRLTTDIPDHECKFCAANTCVQRVVRCDAWAHDIVTHGANEEVS